MKSRRCYNLFCLKQVWAQTYIEKLKIAVMGCIVNGPGESKHADIGISLPGRGEEDLAVVFIDGQKTHTLRTNIFESFRQIVLEYLQKKFSI